MLMLGLYRLGWPALPSGAMLMSRAQAVAWGHVCVCGPAIARVCIEVHARQVLGQLTCNSRPCPVFFLLWVYFVPPSLSS